MKQFFITFFANLAALLFVFGGPLLLFMILIIASFSTNLKGKHLVTIERGSILVFDLSLNVTDSPEHATPTDALTNALSNDNSKSVPLHRLVTAIKKAAKDDRIQGLLLVGSFQLADFGTGYACLKAPTTRDYYVASSASTIYLNPYGEMEMPGLAVVKTYYKEGFDKYGVNVQVT